MVSTGNNLIISLIVALFLFGGCMHEKVVYLTADGERTLNDNFEQCKEYAGELEEKLYKSLEHIDKLKECP